MQKSHQCWTLLCGSLSSAIIDSGIIVFFSIVLYRFLKKNMLEGNVEVKKAVSKNLFYLAVAAVLATIFQIFSSLIRSILPDYRYFIAYNYFLRVFLNFPSIATPIVAIYLCPEASQVSYKECVQEEDM